MEQPQGPEPLIQSLEMVNICHKLVNNIHNQPSVILKKVMEILLIVRVQLRDQQISDGKFRIIYLTVLHQDLLEMLLNKRVELKQIHNTLDPNFLELTQYH